MYLLDGSFISGVIPYVDSDSVMKHPLWGSNLLFNNEEAVINGHKSYIRGWFIIYIIQLNCNFNLLLYACLYYIAGVDFLTTDTYQASIEGFQKYLKLNYEQSYELIKKSVTICRQAIIEENAGEYKHLRVKEVGHVL